MTKEEARKELEFYKNLASNHEAIVKGCNEKIIELETIINKKDDWKSVEVPDDIWQALYEEKALLMADMTHFAYARNEGWIPDWRNVGQVKHGIVQNGNDAEVDWFTHVNSFVFGVVVKSKEIAEEMLEIFGERIERFYSKMY